MNKPKECRQVLIQKRNRGILLFWAVFLISFINHSCSHNFHTLKNPGSDKIIIQVLKLKITHAKGTDRFRVYTQINRKAKEAVLEGLGKFNKHVFTLTVKGNNYRFKEYINNREENNSLDNFSMFPLSADTIFSRLDINNKKPLILNNKKDNIHVEITVIKQDIKRQNLF
jgi:hypothetical protein